MIEKIRDMFFPPKLVVTDAAKLWAEARLAWLGQQFGWDPVKRPPIEPTVRYFPQGWEGTFEEVEELFPNLCGYMHVDSARLELKFFDSEENPLLDHVPVFERERRGPAGLFINPEKKGKLILALDVRIISSPPQVAATLAHELAHVHLLADKRLRPEEHDHEEVTDLLTVFFGMGIISANAAFQFSQWQYGQRAGWSASRSGYLSEQEYGWALANYAWLRDELHPRWAEHLAYNIGTYFRESIRYLEKTGATSLSRGIAHGEPANTPTHDAAKPLGGLNTVTSASASSQADVSSEQSRR